mmetsp:Transcript_3107/g.11901  ORF Transcript_3107/g.11901 Transcript_3107/m.11901 type:complete len:206 (+) Transcript_3107:6900-7517(+)
MLSKSFVLMPGTQDSPCKSNCTELLAGFVSLTLTATTSRNNPCPSAWKLTFITAFPPGAMVPSFGDNWNGPTRIPSGSLAPLPFPFAGAFASFFPLEASFLRELVGREAFAVPGRLAASFGSILKVISNAPVLVSSNSLVFSFPKLSGPKLRPCTGMRENFEYSALREIFSDASPNCSSVSGSKKTALIPVLFLKAIARPVLNVS